MEKHVGKVLINEGLCKWNLMEYIRCIELDYGTHKSILNISMTSIEQHLSFIYLSFLLIPQLTRLMNGTLQSTK